MALVCVHAELAEEVGCLPDCLKSTFPDIGTDFLFHAFHDCMADRGVLDGLTGDGSVGLDNDDGAKQEEVEPEANRRGDAWTVEELKLVENDMENARVEAANLERNMLRKKEVDRSRSRELGGLVACDVCGKVVFKHCGDIHRNHCVVKGNDVAVSSSTSSSSSSSSDDEDGKQSGPATRLAKWNAAMISNANNANKIPLTMKNHPINNGVSPVVTTGMVRLKEEVQSLPLSPVLRAASSARQERSTGGRKRRKTLAYLPGAEGEKHITLTRKKKATEQSASNVSQQQAVVKHTTARKSSAVTNTVVGGKRPVQEIHQGHVSEVNNIGQNNYQQQLLMMQRQHQQHQMAMAHLHSMAMRQQEQSLMQLQMLQGHHHQYGVPAQATVLGQTRVHEQENLQQGYAINPYQYMQHNGTVMHYPQQQGMPMYTPQLYGNASVGQYQVPQGIIRDPRTVVSTGMPMNMSVPQIQGQYSLNNNGAQSETSWVPMQDNPGTTQ